MVNKKTIKKKIVKKEKVKKKAKERIEDIFEDKDIDDEAIESPEDNKEEQKKNISFNFSIKMNKDGLTGSISADGLDGNQKEVFENMVRNSLQNMNHMNKIRQQVPNSLFREFTSDRPRFYKPRRFNRNRVNPCDDFWF